MSEIWSVSLGRGPSYGYVVLKFGHEHVDIIGTGLFRLLCSEQRLNRKGLPDKRSAVGFCLGSGLFGSYNSD